MCRFCVEKVRNKTVKPGDILWYDHPKQSREVLMSPWSATEGTRMFRLPPRGWITVISVTPDPKEPEDEEIVTFLYHGHLCCEYTRHVEEGVKDETR